MSRCTIGVNSNLVEFVINLEYRMAIHIYNDTTRWSRSGRVAFRYIEVKREACGTGNEWKMMLLAGLVVSSSEGDMF